MLPVSDRYLDWVVRDLVGAVDDACAPHKLAVVAFHPADEATEHVLYTNAAAEALVPVLRALLARLESGALRMPVDGGVLWVDPESGRPVPFPRPRGVSDAT